MTTFNQRYKKNFRPGWFKESLRHSLASRGIKTSKYMLPKHLKEQLANAPITISSRRFEPFEPVKIIRQNITKGSKEERVPGRLIRRYPELISLQKRTGASISFEQPGIHNAKGFAAGFYRPINNSIVVFTRSSRDNRSKEFQDIADATLHELRHADDADLRQNLTDHFDVREHERREGFADLDKFPDDATKARGDMEATERAETSFRRMFGASKSDFDHVIGREVDPDAFIKKIQFRALEDLEQRKRDEIKKTLKGSIKKLSEDQAERDSRVRDIKIHDIAREEEGIKEDVMDAGIRQLNRDIRKLSHKVTHRKTLDRAKRRGIELDERDAHQIHDIRGDEYDDEPLSFLQDRLHDLKLEKNKMIMGESGDRLLSSLSEREKNIAGLQEKIRKVKGEKEVISWLKEEHKNRLESIKNDNN